MIVLKSWEKNHVTVFINLCEKLSTHSLQTKIFHTQSFSQEAHNLVELKKKGSAMKYDICLNNRIIVTEGAH